MDVEKKMNSKKLIPELGDAVDYVINKCISKKKVCELSGLSIPTVRAIMQGKLDLRLMNVVKFITVINIMRNSEKDSE